MQALVEWERWFAGSQESERDPNSYHDIGICKFNLGNVSSAIKDLDKAAELQPDYGYRYAARGWMKQSAGDTRGAIADYKKALELDPEDVYTQNNLIILEEKISKK
jgi:Flp pilus assembly protein TadD